MLLFSANERCTKENMFIVRDVLNSAGTSASHLCFYFVMKMDLCWVPVSGTL